MHKAAEYLHSRQLMVHVILVQCMHYGHTPTYAFVQAQDCRHLRPVPKYSNAIVTSIDNVELALL